MYARIVISTLYLRNSVRFVSSSVFVTRICYILLLYIFINISFSKIMLVMYSRREYVLF
jgi:hypothetical protein